MGLQQRLGFQHGGANPVQRGMQHIVSTRLGGKLFQPILYRIDRPLYQWSDGRFTAPGVVVGLPVVMLTTTGAKSGQLRTMPVAAIPYAGDLVVLGTNFAQHRTPGWAANLRTDPRGEVTWRSTTVPVMAVRIPTDDMDDVWRAAAAVYTGFPKYRQRIGDSREVLAFRLEPRE